MLADAKIVSIIQTTRRDLAVSFYRDTLGLAHVKDDGFADVFHVKGVELRLSRVPAVTPSPFAVLGFQVADIAATVDGLIAKGVTMVRIPVFQQDARGVWTAPDGTQVAWFRDPDLNMLSVVQPS